MNDSRRNRTLEFINTCDANKIVFTIKNSFDAGWNACAQDVLDTLGDWATAVSGCGDSSEKFDMVRKELATYFARLNDTDNWIEP